MDSSSVVRKVRKTAKAVKRVSAPVCTILKKHPFIYYGSQHIITNWNEICAFSYHCQIVISTTNTMKNIRISFFIFLCTSLSFVSTAFGQQDSKHVIGFEGGAGISFLRGLEFIEKYHEPAMCFTAGISYQYSFSESFSFFSALDYERKGSVVKFQLTDEQGNSPGELTAHANYDYLVLPMLGRFSFGNHLKMFMNAGPYVGYLMKVTSVTEENDVIPHTEYDLTDESYKYDLGISAGLGVKIPIKDKMTFNVEVRNNLGLVNTHSAPIEEEGGAVKTNSTNLLLSVTFIL
jgi:hypothetical protein